MNRMCKNLENLSIQSVFMLSTLRLRHAENLAGEKKPEKTRDFEPSRMDKVELEGPPVSCPRPLGTDLSAARADRGHCRGRRNAVRRWEPLDRVPRGERRPGASGQRAHQS